MTAASANKTSDSTRANSDCRRPTRDPFLLSPDKFQRVKKAPGSKKLVLGEWVEVLEGDEDADHLS